MLDFSLCPCAFVETQRKIQEIFLAAPTMPYEGLKELLASANVPPTVLNARGLSLLVVGLLSNNTSLVKGAIADGADLSQEIESGYNIVQPLHIALQQGNLEAINALLDAGANPASKPTGGFSAAEFAVRNNLVAGVRGLKTRGFDFSTVTITLGFVGGRTLSALEYARKENFSELAEVLAGE